MRHCLAIHIAISIPIPILLCPPFVCSHRLLSSSPSDGSHPSWRYMSSALVTMGGTSVLGAEVPEPTWTPVVLGRGPEARHERSRCGSFSVDAYV